MSLVIVVQEKNTNIAVDLYKRKIREIDKNKIAPIK